MLNRIKLRLVQITELIRSKGWSGFVQNVIFYNRTFVVVEKDLTQVTERPGPLASSNLKLIEIDKDMLSSGDYRFAVPSRYLKALSYVRRGYKGHGLVRDHVVVGDTWYYVWDTTNDPRPLHRDFRRFGFKTWQSSYVYTFDIFVAPEYRSGGVSAAFQNNAMLALRSKGYAKAFGFYMADNVRAQWCTRVMNRWKEVKKVSVSRFLIFTRVTQPAKPGPLLPKKTEPRIPTAEVKTARFHS